MPRVTKLEIIPTRIRTLTTSRAPSCAGSSTLLNSDREHPSAANLREQAPIDSLDLHVLGTPPAFVLSQDQTLQKVFDLLICTFLIVCAHLKINVGALFCSVFKEQFLLFRRSDFNNITCVSFCVNSFFYYLADLIIISNIYNNYKYI